MTALFIITAILGIIPFLFLFEKRNELQKETLYLTPLIFLSFFSSLYEVVFTYCLKFPSAYWFRLYLLLEFLALFYLFLKIFNSRRITILLYVFLLVYLAYFIFLLFHWRLEDGLKTDSYLSTFSTVFLYVFCLLWFRRVFLYFEVDNLFSSPIFIALCGQLLYFSSTLFLFLMSDYFFKDGKHHFLAFWQLNVIMCIVYRIFLWAALYKGVKK